MTIYILNRLIIFFKHLLFRIGEVYFPSKEYIEAISNLMYAINIIPLLNYTAFNPPTHIQQSLMVLCYFLEVRLSFQVLSDCLALFLCAIGGRPIIE